MIDLGKLSISELLGIAVRSEIDSSQTYAELSQRFSNPLLKEKFKWLSHEEETHKVTLESLHAQLFKGDPLVVPDQPIVELLKKIVVTPSSTLVDVLYQAMDSERVSEEFYASLAGRAEEDPLRKILVYLSKIEHSHLKMLEGELSAALEFEDYAEKPLEKVVT